MTVDQLSRVLEAVRSRFEIHDSAEITLECNPEDLDPSRLRGFRAAGVSRISLGVQSFRTAVLAAVGRMHSRDQAFEAMARIRDVGGLQLSVDLIAGLPGDRFDDWESRLTAVAERGASHVSVYSLEIDKPTSLRRAIDAGRVTVPGGEVLIELYKRTGRCLGELGFTQYEVASFARPGSRSRHNLKYWSDAWYGGFGLGAHGYLAGRRRRNLAALDDYLRRVEAGEDPVEQTESWNLRDRLADALIAGLRPIDGLDLTLLGRRYGVDLRARLAVALEDLEEIGAIQRCVEGEGEAAGERLRLTEEGRLRLDPTLERLLSALGDPTGKMR